MEQISDLLAAGHGVLDVPAPDCAACLERLAGARAAPHGLAAARGRALSEVEEVSTGVPFTLPVASFERLRSDEAP